MNPEQQPQTAPQQPQVQPAMPTAPVAQTTPAVDPGKSMAIGGLILGLVAGAPFGLGVSIAALVKSRKHGFSNTLALVMIIIFALLTPFWLIAVLNFFAGL